MTRSNSPSHQPIRVGIGLVCRGDQYLIRLRPTLPGSPMPGLWEFPGGKCEGTESTEAAALRECREETGIAVVCLGLRRVIEHEYPHGHVELHYFDCAPRVPGAEPAPESGFRWARANELPMLRFPEANAPILAELSAQATAAESSERGMITS